MLYLEIKFTSIFFINQNIKKFKIRKPYNCCMRFLPSQRVRLPKHHDTMKL